MDKPGGRHYRYEQYHQQSQQHAKNNNQKTASLKRGVSGVVDGAGGGGGGGGGGPRALADSADGREGRCLCVPGGKAPSSEGLVQGIFCNLAICALLLLYTLLGSVALLWLEQQQRYHHTAPGVGASLLDAASTRRAANGSSSSSSAAVAAAAAGAGAAAGDGGALAPASSATAAWVKQIEKERSETVEKIWDITVSLNILYRDNWTLLAAKEIARFQDEVVLRLHEEMKHQQQLQQQQQQAGAGAGAERGAAHAYDRRALAPYEWNFPRAFLYSLTVLTTIGYGSITPRSMLGKAGTMVYAVFGIPLMLIYLSSVGSLLSRCVRGALSRSFCCCLCSNCGYCCYDEKRMQERERRLKKKRQQLEIQQQQQQQQIQLQEPFYVRSASTVTGFSASASSTHNNLHSPVRDGDLLKLQQSSSLADPEYGAAAAAAGGDAGAEDGKACGRSRAARAGSLAVPVALCLGLMVLYVCLGAVALVKLEKWTFLEGCYFCFMSLSTIGFGDLVPGGAFASAGAAAAFAGAHPHKVALTPGGSPNIFSSGSNGTVWFCSVYILTGMALTAMCFNILHDEIVHRLKHQAAQLAHEKDAKSNSSSNFLEDAASGADPYAAAS